MTTSGPHTTRGQGCFLEEIRGPPPRRGRMDDKQARRANIIFLLLFLRLILLKHAFISWQQERTLAPQCLLEEPASHACGEP